MESKLLEEWSDCFMKEEGKKVEENVVLFPGVVEKLVSKGMESLKEKSFSEALSYFEQALDIEPNHPQGRFGVALSLIEQSRLNEAKQVTERMLKEDIGNYYDILQVHISLLVQLGEYEEVVGMLEGIMEEERLPAQLAESIYHLLHFSRQMIDDGLAFEKADDELTAPEDLILALHNDPPQKQWVAIQQLGKLHIKHTIEAFKQFLISEKHDPVLKSFVLQLLKEKQLNENIVIHKFGQTITINISNLEDVFHEKFGNDTLKLVGDHLENENPSLYEVVGNILWHYLFAIYPVSPEPLQPSLWAAAIHRIGSEMTGLEEDELQIAKLYNVNLEELLHCSLKITKVEQESFKG